MLLLPLKNPCEDYAAHHKHEKYDDDFKGTAFDFAAMVFETTVLITKVSNCYVNCFALQLSIKVFSSVCIAVVHGHG